MIKYRDRAGVLALEGGNKKTKDSFRLGAIIDVPWRLGIDK